MPSQFSILTPMKNFKQGALMEAFKNATTLASTPEEKEEQPPDQNGHSEKAVDVNGLPKSPYEDEDDEDKPKSYEPSWFSKFLNYLFCRPDLAKKKLMAKPVSIAGLVSIGFTRDSLSLRAVQRLRFTLRIYPKTSINLLFLLVPLQKALRHSLYYPRNPVRHYLRSSQPNSSSSRRANDQRPPNR